MKHLRSRAVLAAALGAAVLSGCSSARDGGPVVENAAPAFRVVCEIVSNNRAYNTADGVVSSPTTQRHEFTVSGRRQVRARLEELGLGTAERPCSRLDVQPIAP